MKRKAGEICSRCGQGCDDPFDAFWFENEHFCQECYMVVTSSHQTDDNAEDARS